MTANHNVTGQPTRRGFLLKSSLTGAGLLFGLDSRANQNAGVPLALSRVKGMVTPETDQAIERGLAYLSRTQSTLGSFSGGNRIQASVAIASLAGLAFMSGGHLPGQGRYGNSVRGALKYVLSHEQANPSGFLHHPRSNSQVWMYSHGFATLFLAQLYGMVPNRTLQKQLRDTLERAIQLIISSQNREGGWRYEPRPTGADVSVTICQIMALRAAREVGIAVPKSIVDRCIQYVMDCQNSDGGFMYMRRHREGSAFPRSAAGVVALYSAGVYDGPAIQRGLGYLMQFLPSGLRGRRRMDPRFYYYGHYYAAQAMWTAGGDYWNRWYPAIRDELLQRGRYRPDGAWSDLTWGEAYATAMALIILQIPNSYLPILQK